MWKRSDKRFEIVSLIGSLSIFFTGLFIFSLMEYRLHEEEFYKRIDDKLRNAAYATDALLSPEFHDHALSAASISSEEYTRNMERLSLLAKQLNVIYIYTMVEREGKIYFTASNATDEERKTGVNLTHYFDYYDDASEKLVDVFRTGKASYDEYTDKWGTFRSIFLPMKSPGGHQYIIAADIQTDAIHKQLEDEIFHLILRLMLALVCAIPLVAWQFRRMNEEKVYRLSHFDELTGLANKIQLESYCPHMLSQAERNGTLLAIMYIDLDHFKYINDSLGHAVGDAVLIETARRLKELLRKSDIVARYSADEFVMALSIHNMHGIETVAWKILETLNVPYHVDGKELHLSASVGIALFPSDGQDYRALIKNAHTALYRAKTEGRNNFCFVTEEMQEKLTRYALLTNALHDALKNDELYLVYQPQISAVDERVVGIEALLRWRHPEYGDISPSEFIPIAEETGLILQIGEWIFRSAIRQTKIWNEMLPYPIITAVNLSSVQFRDPHLISSVTNILDEIGLAHEFLELELTESMAMHNPDAAIHVMNMLHEQGIRMSIDDFGTGYSSLNYLKKFKIYKLKIDQSFIRDIYLNMDDREITRAIIHMARGLGLKTIAEGVEKAEQLAFLKNEGCDEIQGYYYSRPCTVEEFEKFIQCQT